MSECFCDFERPSFYAKSERGARKAHRCYECARAILPGERYEHTVAKYDGTLQAMKTCGRCLALRDWVQAHVPCFCWLHGSMLDDARETVDQYWQEAPGLLFGYLRRRVAVRRAPLWRTIASARN